MFKRQDGTISTHGRTVHRFVVGLLTLVVAILVPQHGSAFYAAGAPASVRPGVDVHSGHAVSLTRSRRAPIFFALNEGQTSHIVHFLANLPGYTLFLTPSSAILSLQDQGNNRPTLPMQFGAPLRSRAVPLAIKYLHANPHARIVGLNRLQGRVNYFIGAHPRQWRTNVPTYARVEYQGIYPGIDLVFYSHNGQLEYDWLVHPHASPGSIDVAFLGPRTMTLGPHGSLRLGTATGQLLQSRAVAYQGSSRSNERIPVAYQLTSDAECHFGVSSYNHARTLVIDPTLDYATYLGASGTDHAYNTVIDPSGNTLITGQTNSSNFPVLNAYQSAYGGEVSYGDVIITELSPSGVMLFSTYLGGSGDDGPLGLALDRSNDIYVTGVTTSTNFPTANAYQSTYGGGSEDVFLTKLSPTGSQLQFSTYFGGNGDDRGYAMVLDASGDAYIAGQTMSTNLPTLHAYQSTFGTASGYDVMLAEFSAGGALVLSTYLGGSISQVSNGLALDGSGNIYVAGQTSSSDFPTLHAFQSTFGGGTDDTFLAKFSQSGVLLWSTYLGGSGDDHDGFLGVDGSGDPYITGNTTSSDLPTKNAFQAVYNGSGSKGLGDVFLAKFSTAGTLLWSTYLGGDDAPNQLQVDRAGNAWVVGSIISAQLPVVNASQPTYGGGVSYGDGFVAKFSPTGNAVFVTYLGGSNDDACYGVAVDGYGNGYVTGSTLSSNFPTQSAVQPTYGGGVQEGWGDAFVTSFSPTGTVLYSTYLGGSGEEYDQGITVDVGGDAVVYGGTTSTNFPTARATQASTGGGTDAFVAELTSPATTSMVPIEAGWTLISVPLQSEPLDTAAGLLASLDAAGQLGPGAVHMLATYANGRYVLFAPGYSSDVPLTPAEGVFVLSGLSGTWTAAGDAYAIGQPISLAHGWNLVAAPYPAAGLDASAINSEIGAACGLQEITTYGPTGYTVWTPSSTTSLHIPATSGFWMECTKGTTWTPS